MSNQDIQLPLCFVIMPFSGDYDEIYKIIKSAGNLAGFQTQRADERYTPDTVPERIQQLLDSADVLVAEISEENPNVYYELGLAHGNRKPVILICKKATVVPFDLHHWNQIRYETPTDLGKQLVDVLEALGKKLESTPKKCKETLPRDLEVGQLAVKCRMISPMVLEKRLDELTSDSCPHDTISEMLLATGDINQEQMDVLVQAQQWVADYLESVSRSLGEPVWVRQLHRHVKFISRRNKSQGDPPIEKRYISLLDEEVDVYDEAIFSDHIFFQKFKQDTFTAHSTGIVVLHEMETERYKCSIPEHSRKYYKNSGGRALGYCISTTEGSSFPLLVNRTFTYLNGFQFNPEEDNREAGIGIRQPIEELILTVDFELLPLQVSDIKGELRRADRIEELEVKMASPNCYYITRSFPPKGSAVYIKWKWEE